MGVLLLIRTTTEGNADHWIQKIRETGIRTQKLRVSGAVEGDEWHIDGEQLKKKLKAIGMVIIEEVHSEVAHHEENTANGLSTEQEVTENTFTGHHDESHLARNHIAEDTKKVDSERAPHTQTPHVPEDFTEHHHELHTDHNAVQVTTDDMGNAGEERHSRPTHRIPHSPRSDNSYRANLDPNRFVTPQPLHSSHSPRSKSMPRFVNERFSKLLASASISNNQEKTEKSADDETLHTRQSEGFATGHASHRQNEREVHSPHSAVLRNDGHESLNYQDWTRKENRQSAVTIRGREEINRGFAEHPVSRRPNSVALTGSSQLVHFGTPHTKEQSGQGHDAFRFDSVLSDYKEDAHHDVAEANQHENMKTTATHDYKDDAASNHHTGTEETDSSHNDHHHDHHDHHHDHHDHHHHHHHHDQHHHDHHEAIDHDEPKLENNHERATKDDSTDQESNESDEDEEHENEHSTAANNQRPWQHYDKDVVFKKHDEVIRKYLTAASPKKLAAHSFAAFAEGGGNDSDSD